ncbi:N-acetyltransferase [Marinomonas rhizomae]|uniref:RimJ/RimL family protein N-acetyltransferase n=1 Tax=Marinomonas rhizomae TaxID=491948 RepID=A0A366J1E7_9GAMM|nr:GNAT family N-acetyltransferase [Marinomonas rhizomae]RBP80084.1 RimJ/RimL family protein N-acetyltransferase [Marinomonas rhizomae]RNF72007.1 N-acetyltransferase [Marinomonas rhizomae]
MAIPFLLRPVQITDAECLLAWRNDTVTREASHNQDIISLEAHIKWLSNSLKSDQRLLWIAEVDGIAVATCRADRLENAWELSWTVAPEARGKGIAYQMLANLVRCLDEPLVAQVKPDNIASIKVAERVGFVLDKQENGVLFYVYPTMFSITD